MPSPDSETILAHLSLRKGLFIGFCSLRRRCSCVALRRPVSRTEPTAHLLILTLGRCQY